MHPILSSCLPPWTYYAQEPVLFEDVLCQLHDMLQPDREGCYTLADVKRSRPQSGLLFNTLFNLHKFMAYENRDPFALRAEQLGEGEGGAPLSDWDRFARGEYLRLAVEEEPEDMAVDGADTVWVAGGGVGPGVAGRMMVEEGEEGEPELLPAAAAGTGGGPGAGCGAEILATAGSAGGLGGDGMARDGDASGSDGATAMDAAS